MESDVVAIRGKETPLIAELKLSINLTVILQAVERLSLTPKVYIGIPKQSNILKKKRKQVLKLLRMLGLGLVVIDPGLRVHSVEVLLDPGEYKTRQSTRNKERLLGEFDKRVGDPNLGGTVKRGGIMTAYRQQALKIAWFLLDNGPSKAAQIAHTLQVSNARQIVYRDVYGWFDRVSHGVYDLSPRGKREIFHWQNRESS